MFGEVEVLVAAKNLCDGDKIYSEPCEEVTYFHIMFDQHEIVYSEGVPLESFLVGDHAIERNRDTYDELVNLFPELADPTHLARIIARPQIKKYEAALLR
ncbi:hypothetical protein RC74_14635 [Falsihalocynthiibacter arcticus]|uniref:Hedgehog/Intein (Hint) domain-containing protein n=2 Tax=Falsihalocynthiibacter arcticus TaxID=1579316 RepID=A0A126V394_9RHOB|nr:hypothetical protein RC74_14635 [Falsihalocynthiibacter arcticus]